MPRHEQKLTVQSPLRLLSQPGALRQETLAGFHPPHDNSPFSIPRLAFILRRGVESIKSFRDRAGRRGYILTTEHRDSNASSSLSWVVVDGVTEVTLVQKIRGENIKLSQEGATAILTNEQGANIRYHLSGAAAASPVPLHHPERTAQQETPWYLKTAEAVGRAGVRLENIEAEIITSPAGTNVTKNNKPVLRFKLRILGTSEPVELPADVFNDTSRERGGNPYRIQQTLKKKLQPGDKVLITGHFHVDKTTFQNDAGVKPYERRWVRLLVIDRKPTG